MRISEFLQPTDVLDDLAGSSPRELLEALSLPVAASLSLAAQPLAEALLARESLASTGIGDGIALPHARIPGLATLRASFGRSRKGIRFHAPDAGRVHLLFAVFVPEAGPSPHLHLLARLGRIFRSRTLRDALLGALGPDDMYDLIVDEDARYQEAACAP